MTADEQDRWLVCSDCMVRRLQKCTHRQSEMHRIARNSSNGGRWVCQHHFEQREQRAKLQKMLNKVQGGKGGK